jgi:hypothetical protein
MVIGNGCANFSLELVVNFEPLFFTRKKSIFDHSTFASVCFGHRTSKPDIFDHPTLKNVHNWPSGGFDG